MMVRRDAQGTRQLIEQSAPVHRRYDAKSRVLRGRGEMRRRARHRPKVKSPAARQQLLLARRRLARTNDLQPQPSVKSIPQLLGESRLVHERMQAGGVFYQQIFQTLRRAVQMEPADDA